MRRARANSLARSLGTTAVFLLAAGRAAAETDPCATAASVSPCFDADPFWIPTRPTPFLAVRSASAVAKGELALVLGLDVSHRPVVLVTPSPHPEGQEIDVVQATSTVTLGARYGLGHGIDAGVALPFVPHQSGAGTESVTNQHSDALASVALRDPRVELGATLLGRDPASPVALGTSLELGLPLGSSSALAGASGPTVAPSFTAEGRFAPLTIDLDVGLRLVRAVSLGTVREGSSLALALGLSLELLDDPALALAVEASMRPGLAGRPVGAPAGTLDLPAEWLASARLDPLPGWSFLLGAGSGLPLSSVEAPGMPPAAMVGVTSPDFRIVALGRCTLPTAY
jgi:hypothetical protein